MLEDIVLKTLEKTAFGLRIAGTVLLLAQTAIIFADRTGETFQKPTSRTVFACLSFVMFIWFFISIFRGKNWKVMNVFASGYGFVAQAAFSGIHASSSFEMISKIITGTGFLIFGLLLFLSLANFKQNQSRQDMEQQGGQSKKRKKFF